MAGTGIYRVFIKTTFWNGTLTDPMRDGAGNPIDFTKDEAEKMAARFNAANLAKSVKSVSVLEMLSFEAR